MTSVPNPSLEAGNTAFQSGDYEEAIAHFEGVCAIELDENRMSRAQQGLVVAYCHCDRAEEAIALCHRLVQAPTPANTWATETLADLIQRYPEANTLGLVPVRQSSRSPQTPNQPSTPKNPKSKMAVVPSATPQEAAPTVFVPGRQWRNAERATQWKSLKKPKLWKLGLMQLVSAIALFYVVRFTFTALMAAINGILVEFPFFKPIQLLYGNPTYVVLAFLLVVFIASPWLLDGLLKQFYGLERFSIPKLSAQFPEAAKVLQKMTRQKKLPTPKLGILPTSAPVSMTYGLSPRTARIVISEGLLEQLEDSELAVLYATEIAQIINQDFIFFSGAAALLQIPFALYWQIARWGERFSASNVSSSPTRSPEQKKNKTKLAIARLSLSIFLGWICGILASLFYGIYWLWRVPLLWASRGRLYYSDRLAAEYMGNPNALSRALLKITVGLAENIQQRQQTGGLLEGFDLLMPIGHRQALSIGSIPDKTPFKEVLTWECTNPYRHWLALANSHPLIGDRLYLLNRYANHWQLPAEIDLPPIVPPTRTLIKRLVKLKNSYRALPILQSAVLSALFFGLLLRGVFWLLGLLDNFIRGRWLSGSGLIWMYNADNNMGIVYACILFAFSISIIVWINGYFPNIRIAPTRNDPRLQDLLSNPEAVPPKSQGLRLTGQLIGREGLSNWLIQDLILKTPTGSIKLHFFTKLGPIGNLLWGLQSLLFWLCRWLPLKSLLNKYICLYPRPSQLIDREVEVLGWFRRGSTPWIDVDIIRTPDGKMIRSGYPVWVTGLAIGAAIWGAWLIVAA